ncbi:hypothetical protein [Paracoccus sp. (in: a-proteobacteria)]|uniref:hypothetical protein n=1 Tax=Paracoccus sp. TaxID=267 RepID=UPI0026DF75F5|nr:hypothetical protein [Paracoccus sp. (in: a-proteobacteria)]MDO5646304.1 hypothetical protein [Paracoccus sp. (in: a-proteobacteria)]
MSDAFALVIDGLDHLDNLSDLPKDVVRAARIAVNDAATRGRTAMAREVLREVNFPADYVTPRNKRLFVSKQARNNNLEAVITARSRPTSLARFTKESTAGRKKGGVRVEVKPGVVRVMPGAFLMRLRSGSGLTDTKHNLGLAVRTAKGKPPPGYRPTQIGKNLWLLYGPSVSQVIHSARNNGGVATDLTPDVQRMLEDEFWRQMELGK